MRARGEDSENDPLPRGSRPQQRNSSAELEPDWIEKSPLGRSLKSSDPDDPLGLVPLCSRRLRERSILVDLRDLIENSLARIALFRDRYDPCEPLEPWLLEHVDTAMRRLVEDDSEAERDGPPVPPWQPRFLYLQETLRIRLEDARRACIAVNDLDDEARYAFFEIFVMGRSSPDLVGEGYSVPRVAKLVERALRSIQSCILLPREYGPDEIDEEVSDDDE